jgi:hypothetical protein
MRRILCNIAVLRDEYAALRLQSTGNGVFAAGQAGWLFPLPRPGPGFDEKQQLPVKEEEEDTSHLQTYLESSSSSSMIMIMPTKNRQCRRKNSPNRHSFRFVF